MIRNSKVCKMNLTEYIYKSTYTKDYVKKTPKKFQQIIQRQEFKDPVNEGFRHYLVLAEKNIQAPDEDGDIYLDKFKEDYQELGKIYFEHPLDKNAIFTNNLTKGLVSEYQTKYCDIAKDNEFYREQRSKKIIIPDDTEIPETTYTWSFREPARLCPTARDKSLIVITPDNLGTNEKINQILNVKTGRSEYMQTISKFGKFALENQIHGRVRPDVKNTNGFQETE